MMELVLFTLVSIGLIAIPGPNVLVIVSSSISQGRARGLQTVAGTSAAMAVQLFTAAVGTAYFVAALAEGLLWLKWVGAAYLLYLGVRHLSLAFRANCSSPGISAVGSFQRGFWVSLTNPKTILFFGAFLPQFTSATSPYMPQIAVLSAVFWGLAVLLDSTYALLSSTLASLVRSKKVEKYQQGLSGLIYCFAGSLLAASKNT